MLGDRARRGFEGLGVSVGRTAGVGFGFDGVGGFEVGLGIEEVIGVLALGRGIESEDITRGRGLLGSIGWMTGKWEGVGGRQRPETEHDRQLKRFIVTLCPGIGYVHYHLVLQRSTSGLKFRANPGLRKLIYAVSVGEAEEIDMGSTQD